MARSATVAPSPINQSGEYIPHKARPPQKNKSYFSLSSSAVPLSGNMEEMASKILSEGNFRGGRLSLSKYGNMKKKNHPSKQVFTLSFPSPNYIYITKIIF